MVFETYQRNQPFFIIGPAGMFKLAALLFFKVAQNSSGYCQIFLYRLLFKDQTCPVKTKLAC